MYESPLKKKRKTKKDVAEKPAKCLIHVDPSADDSTLSTFKEQSWKVSAAFYFSYIFHAFSVLCIIFFALFYAKGVFLYCIFHTWPTFSCTTIYHQYFLLKH